MATVYSLICFGGLSGKTVTFTDAGDVVNLANHGLRQGITGIVFSTAGSLPIGIAAGTTYYPRDGVDANKFTIYPTKSDALAGTNQVTFTGTGSGTHTVKSAYMLGLTAGELSRYGSYGGERIYNGLAGFLSARKAATIGAYDTEHCEIGDDEFTDNLSASLSFSAFQAAKVVVETKVNGSRTKAYHNGVPNSGYILRTSEHAFDINMLNTVFDGFTVHQTASRIGFYIQSPLCTVRNCIIIGNPSSSGQRGLYLTDASGALVYNNVIYNFAGTGIDISSTNPSIIGMYNNIVTKCITGFLGTSTNKGWYFNNISVGNTTNWGLRGVNLYAAACNVGEPSDKKTVVADSTTNKFTQAAHGLYSNARVRLTTTGTLPGISGGGTLEVGKTYFAVSVGVNDFAVSATASGAAIDLVDNGTGTHYQTNIWETANNSLYVDMSNPGEVFVDYANNDFRLSSTSPLIDVGQDLTGTIPSADILDSMRPNYEAASYPDNNWDVGPFEYDHGDGLVPVTATLTIAANVSLSGAEIRIYDADNTPAGTLGTELSGTESNPSTTYTYSATSLLNNTIYIQVMQSGYEEFLTSHTVTNINETLTLTLKADVNA